MVLSTKYDTGSAQAYRSLSRAERHVGDYSGLHTSTAEAAPIQKAPLVAGVKLKTAVAVTPGSHRYALYPVHLRR